MSSTTLAHRSVSNIRPSAQVSGAPPSPHTPLRSISSTYGSPSALRAEEDCVVLELGARYLRAGFAGDATPKAVVDFGPEEQRRAGDYRRWRPGYEKAWRERLGGKKWGERHELWRADLRDVDLGEVSDKIERAVREAFTKYLLIDSRPRKVVLALPSTLPTPLLSTVLDTIFTNFQAPNISLYSSPSLTTVAAGLRASMVVDIGWAETTVTGIYEFREVSTNRSIRAMKMLGQEMQKMLAEEVDPKILQHESEELRDRALQEFMSFEECEEIVERVAWCKPSTKSSHTAGGADEEGLESKIQNLNISDSKTSVTLRTTIPPRTLNLPLSQLSQPVETALLATHIPSNELDDEELPIPLLIYRNLLRLPFDLRSICMSRIIFVGGGSHVLGLKSRIISELNSLIAGRGWDPVQGKAVKQLKENMKLARARRMRDDGPTEVESEENIDDLSAALRPQERDEIAEKIKKEADQEGRTLDDEGGAERGVLRAVDSLGAWTGGSLLAQLKIPAVSSIEKESWAKDGLAGASKGEGMTVSVAAGARSSMGPGAFKAAGERSSWTLGLWG